MYVVVVDIIKFDCLLEVWKKIQSVRKQIELKLYEINIFNVKEVNLEEEIFIVFYDDIIKNEVGLGLNLMDEILFEGGCFS